MKKITLAFLLVAALFISAFTYNVVRSEDIITLYSYESARGDAEISRMAPNTNGGSSEELYLYAWTQQGKLNINRFVLDFNTSEIPQHTVIGRAYLNLYFNPTSKYDKILGDKGSVGSESFKVEELISDWNEKTVTWTTQPKADTKTHVIFGKKSNSRANYLQLDITTLVQNVINKPVNERFGFRLKFVKEKPYNVYFFASGNYPDVNLRPSLEIEYSK
jgi:hypothetical protein